MMKLHYLEPMAELNLVDVEDLLTLSIGNTVPNIGEEKNLIDFDAE